MHNNIGPDGGNPDEVMYDAYGAPRLRGGPFPSDIPPPPVLMPVPGAGYVESLACFSDTSMSAFLVTLMVCVFLFRSPLGPFVPAPPEVAMRMLREQGGPSQFEANGGRGRKARPGPGPAPILAMSPAFRPDPRRLRR